MTEEVLMDVTQSLCSLSSDQPYLMMTSILLVKQLLFLISRDLICIQIGLEQVCHGCQTLISALPWLVGWPHLPPWRKSSRDGSSSLPLRKGSMEEKLVCDSLGLTLLSADES
ncbi:hypothetical protein KP509_12G074800 [Ceratopteris richardii]|uniref:Uncharacterized protein n=1 Tax=Ceratopteris richardii TaxID=49495 RepID=A0A8T2TMU9_CERRI|nr:hypothetical protein KP509_12G074800 [Ceratopteris richardii]